MVFRSGRNPPRALVCMAGIGLLAAVACGYRLGEHPCQSPVAAKNINVPLFENLSFEPRLEDLMTVAFRERIQALPCVTLCSPQEADAVLKGRIVSVDEYTAAVNESFFAMEYRMRVVMAVSLERNGDGEVLWRDDSLEEEVSFYASSDPLLQKDNREEALMQLSSRLSERAVDRLLLGF
jgi:outer membrane lipopolysaccharide assembly protein LptE/RlpB